MVLHGDKEDKVTLAFRLRLKDVDDLIERPLVADIIAQLVSTAEVIKIQEFVKSHQRIDSVSLPAASVVRMHADGPVSQAFQVGGRGRNIGMDILLEHDASRRKEGHGVAAQALIFRVRRVSALDRYHQMSRRIFLHQGTEPGHIILACVKVSKHRQIREGFVHNDDDIRILLCRRSCGAVIGILCLPGDLFCLRRTVSVRFIHIQK